MTTAEMPAGPELDRAVAEFVKGWRYRDRRAMGWGSGPDVYWTGDEVSPTRQGFAPSTNIADAWLVVERMRQTCEAHLHGVDDLWSVCFVVADTSARTFVGEANTLPLAICLAALAACGPKGQ